VARLYAEYLQASSWGRRILIADECEMTDALVREIIEVLTLIDARLYGSGGACSRAMRAVTGDKAAGRVGVGVW